jgi:thioesterase domain-containing protein/acyl carrier protein
MNTAAQLMDIWSRILRCPVGPDSDFFDLGGDSLTAVGMVLEVERRLECKLPITAIYDAPTVSALAALIEGEAQPHYCHFVPLKAGDETAPLYIVHGLGGTVMELAQLGKLIQTDKAVYGIQARGLDGRERPLDNVADMADLYASLIRERQPHGPYLVGGYSFGGCIAVEVARRLGAENIAELLLLDAFANPRTWPRQVQLQVKSRRLLKQLRAQAKQGPRANVEFVAKKMRRLLVRRSEAQRAAERANYINNWLGAVDPNLPPALRETRVASDQALFNFRPSPYSGKVTFLRASRPGAVFPANVRAVYGKIFGQLELHTIDGDHQSILAANAPLLAARISVCLARHGRATAANTNAPEARAA